MKIAPLDSHGEPDRPEGYEMFLNPQQAEDHNLRILSCSNGEESDKPIMPWLIPGKEKLPLLFFRRIFTGLQEQHKQQLLAREQHGDVLEREIDAFDPCDVGEDTVPLEAFQRAFERLFFLLGDEHGFDANSCDENGNGMVGWAEFSYVFKILEQRDFAIHYSIPERIYLTFDNPESSFLASCISAFVLLVICASSSTFIMGTNRTFQEEPVGLEKPLPIAILSDIEGMCLTVFVIEYFIRFCTSWAVRTEVAHKDKLLKVTLGRGPLYIKGYHTKMMEFFFGLANLIDFVAILPGMISWIDAEAMEGGAFVVLRLIRLTRVFRFSATINEPLLVITRTMMNSTKALYLLGFNGLLGVLIFGSLMYLVEGKGEWDPAARAYSRYEGREWNTTVLNEFTDVTSNSPFRSIPHSFWWAATTFTTVGYGDSFPTTSLGYIIAVATMVFSLIIAALPVGILGENFTQVWDDFALDKKMAVAQLKEDRKFITAAIQRIEPFAMSKLLYIEIWNERLADDRVISVVEKTSIQRPDIAEFMGRASLFLELDQNNIVQGRVRTVNLNDGAEGALPGREVTGHVTIQYDWVPEKLPSLGDLSPGSKKQTLALSSSLSDRLHGKLTVTVLHAEGLMNLSYTSGRMSGSNPYARVFCYPQSPTNNTTLTPTAWRSPTVTGTVNPKWNAHHIFSFCWDPIMEEDESEGAKEPMDGGMFADPTLSKKGQVSKMVCSLGRDLNGLQDEVRMLNGRITRLPMSPEPHG